MATPSMQSHHFDLARRYPPHQLAAQLHVVQSVALLPEVFDAVPDLIMLLNDCRQIVFANSALRTLAQIDSSAELGGRRPGELFGCVHSDEEPGGCGTAEPCTTCGALRSVLNSQRKGTTDIQESHFTRKDGVSFDFEVHASPIELEDRLYTVVTVKDISHEKRRRALEHVFFHDVMNGLNIVVNSAYLIDGADPETLGYLQETLKVEAESLKDEIHSHQELMAAENRELAIHPASIQTLGLLAELASVYRSVELAKDRTLLLDPASEPITFSSDPTLLRRVLGNMVKNALEATESGQVITLKCAMEGDQVTFSVHNPTYIPRYVQLQIFQRSFSTKGENRGLGTYSMRLLSEQYLGGEVAFTSTRKQGTTFYARYPLGQGD